jgi:thymidylate kinase
LNFVASRSVSSQVIKDFFSSLDASGVSYCHWKSNMRLGDTLAGGDDVDILVRRSDAGAFQSVLAECGFKYAVSSAGLAHPGVFHAFTLDEARARLVHVHAYFQVVSGDSLVKNYRLQIEHALMSGDQLMHGVRVPKREVELVVFAVRTILKHVAIAEIYMASRDRRKAASELAWLLSESNMVEVGETACALFPELDTDLVADVMSGIRDEKALLKRVCLGWRVAWRLRHRRRIGVIKAFTSRIDRVMALVLGRFRQRKNLALLSGGLLVALVGPKATGKSTLGAALAERLGEHLDVRRIHAGKPPATLLTFLPRLFVPMARKLIRSERPSEYQKPEKRKEMSYSFIHVLNMVFLAYDRQRLLCRSLRHATAGSIIISDRYPSASIGAIDSSGFSDEAISKCQSVLKRSLMKLERALYARIPRPDLVIRLKAPVERSLLRDAERNKNGGPDPEAVLRRRELESRADYFGLPETIIDTDRELEETIRDTVKAVWMSL